MSEAYQFEEKDFQLALRIQSDLNNLRGNPHVVKLLHLFGSYCVGGVLCVETPTEILSITEVVNGTIEEYQGWIASTCLVQNIFKQIVAGYANLRAVGFYHCNLSAKTVFLQLKPSEENPGIPEILAKIAGFEQAVAVSSDGGFVVGESRVCGECSYAAPEVGGIFVMGDSVSGTVSARIRRTCGVWAWFCSFC